MNPSRDLDACVDEFVERVNRSARRRIRADDVPERLRVGDPDYGHRFDWRIERCTHTPWIPAIESILRQPLPAAYRSLVTRYVFPAFEWGPLWFLSNTGMNLYNELSAVLLRNRSAAHGLIDAGFIQFAWPATGDADPVCFDTRHPGVDGEPRIVQIRQTSLLSGPVDVAAVMAPSLCAILELSAVRAPETLPG